MAALSDTDLRAILGDNYENVGDSTKEKTLDQKRHEAKSVLSALEDKNFSSFACIVVGIALAVSAWYTAKDMTFTIQMAVAAAFVVVGLGALAYFRGKIAEARQNIAALG